ncbi:MAG: hypothetical protein ACHRHE_12610 [Tepidisphaerales bacterium]
MNDQEDKAENANENANANVDESAAEEFPGGEETIETGFEAVAEHSPQKSALLLLLLIVLVGGGGIYFMHVKSGPTPAQASPESRDAQQTVSEFLTDGGKNISQMKDTLRNTEKVVQGFLQYPTMTQVKLEELKTNPFEFEKPKPVKPTEDPAEIARQEAAEKARLAAIEKEKQEIRTAARQLQLQSILYSDNRGTCMIGSRAYTQGKQVNGFTIEEIGRTFVVVSRKGTLAEKPYVFKLTMQQPE